MSRYRFARLAWPSRASMLCYRVTRCAYLRLSTRHMPCVRRVSISARLIPTPSVWVAFPAVRYNQAAESRRTLGIRSERFVDHSHNPLENLASPPLFASILASPPPFRFLLSSVLSSLGERSLSVTNFVASCRNSIIGFRRPMKTPELRCTYSELDHPASSASCLNRPSSSGMSSYPL